ncbi:MAG: HD domain-containing protein [Candidatus Ornithospirochaeta sp.]|nr:HD domain-containing protein [Candidatus Ornithospirochaeta sp.]
MTLLVNRFEDDSLLKKRKRERTEDIRGAYYRDTTAIIHSSPFRRLKHTTQVFFAPSNDHICTRMEHVLHVASIASTICRPLGLDTELAWAIGVGHDLGHTPFGHVGERIIDSMRREKGLGRFDHEVNSLRVADFLSDNGKGLNLTYAVRDGIVCHNGESLSHRIKPTFRIRDLDSITVREGLIPATFEGAVVRFSDSIAYLGRDYEDAYRLGILKGKPLPGIVTERLGSNNSEIINTLVNDIIASASQEEGIGFSNPVFEAVKAFSEYNYSNIYRSSILNGYNRYFSRLIKLIDDYLEELYSQYALDESGYIAERNMLAAGFYNHIVDMYPKYIQKEGSDRMMIIDYIAGMTDNFCLDCANEILKPEHLNEEIDQSQTGKWFDAIRP